MGRRKKRAAPEVEHSRVFVAATLSLLLLGLASSAYLFNIYIKVNSPGGQAVESFCSINEGFDCVTVANSAYSAFLGVPIALYGIDFFLVMLLLVGLAGFRIIALRRWDSLLFAGTALSLPICALLSWISATLISSFCIICMTIYGVCVALFLLLLIAARGELRALLVAGPRELMGKLKQPAWLAGLGVVGVAVLSQFIWAPGLKAAPRKDPDHAGVWKNLETSGLTIGPADAPVKIEEFTDFECPHCRRAHKVMMSLLTSFPGKIHLIHRDFPLDMRCNPMITRPMHPHACLAAAFALCAGEQDKYWPYEELLFKSSEGLTEQSLRRFGKEIGLDQSKLERCVKSPSTAQSISNSIQDGKDRGLTGTPTFFVNGEKVAGLRPLSFWTAKLEALIKGR